MHRRTYSDLKFFGASLSAASATNVTRVAKPVVRSAHRAQELVEQHHDARIARSLAHTTARSEVWFDDVEAQCVVYLVHRFGQEVLRVSRESARQLFGRHSRQGRFLLLAKP